MSTFFLMKAQKLDLRRLNGKWTWSIKFDGMRAFWDGGITRGRTDVPWCLDRKATGLWSINAKPIFAPDWWLDQLPKVPVDGELWAGVQNFQQVMSACRKYKPINSEWMHIRFMAFDAPGLLRVFNTRIIKTPTCQMLIDRKIKDYMVRLAIEKDLPWALDKGTHLTPENEIFKAVEQTPFDYNWKKFENETLPEILMQGHEGVMFRRVFGEWEPRRSWNIMKYKPFFDDEGEVIGFVWGRQTDKDSRNLGRAGSLIVRWRDKNIKVSGLNNQERELCTEVKLNEAITKQGKEEYEMPLKHFERGQKITFKYRELTNSGIPKEARYWRSA